MSGDHAGHIFGDRFGGSGELDNLMSQLGKTNQSGYKVMENGWAKVINNGGSITDVKWSAALDSTGRPTSYTVEWFENGEYVFKEFFN